MRSAFISSGVEDARMWSGILTVCAAAVVWAGFAGV
jgi:hypothetical protein